MLRLLDFSLSISRECYNGSWNALLKLAASAPSDEDRKSSISIVPLFKTQDSEVSTSRQPVPDGPTSPSADSSDDRQNAGLAARAASNLHARFQQPLSPTGADEFDFSSDVAKMITQYEQVKMTLTSLASATKATGDFEMLLAKRAVNLRSPLHNAPAIAPIQAAKGTPTPPMPHRAVTPVALKNVGHPCHPVAGLQIHPQCPSPSWVRFDTNADKAYQVQQHPHQLSVPRQPWLQQWQPSHTCRSIAFSP